MRFFGERARDFFADDAAALDALDQLFDHVRAVPASEDRALVHGDYHSANMIFRGDQVAAICDFDMVQEAPRAFDIGYFLYRTAGRPSRSGGGPARLDRSVARAFLEGYCGGKQDSPPSFSLRDSSHEALRFAWFNVLLVAHNTRAVGNLRDWMADTIALGQDLKQWTEEDALV